MRHIAFVKSEQLDEVEQLRAIIENAPTQGYTVAQVRLAVRVLDRLTGQNVTFEEEEWRFVVDRVKQAQWVKANAAVLAFVDRIEQAAETSAAP
jgi:hypothetical protein